MTHQAQEDTAFLMGDDLNYFDLIEDETTTMNNNNYQLHSARSSTSSNSINNNSNNTTRRLLDTRNLNTMPLNNFDYDDLSSQIDTTRHINRTRNTTKKRVSTLFNVEAENSDNSIETGDHDETVTAIQRNDDNNKTPASPTMLPGNLALPDGQTAVLDFNPSPAKNTNKKRRSLMQTPSGSQSSNNRTLTNNTDSIESSITIETPISTNNIQNPVQNPSISSQITTNNYEINVTQEIFYTVEIKDKISNQIVNSMTEVNRNSHKINYEDLNDLDQIFIKKFEPVGKKVRNIVDVTLDNLELVRSLNSGCSLQQKRSSNFKPVVQVPTSAQQTPVQTSMTTDEEDSTVTVKNVEITTPKNKSENQPKPKKETKKTEIPIPKKKSPKKKQTLLSAEAAKLFTDVQPLKPSALVYAKFPDGQFYPALIKEPIITEDSTQRLQIYFVDDGAKKKVKKQDILRINLAPVGTRIYYMNEEGEYMPSLVKGYLEVTDAQNDSNNQNEVGYLVECIETDQEIEVPRRSTCLKNPIPGDLKERYKIPLQPLTPSRNGLQFENVISSSSSRNRSSRYSIGGAPTPESLSSSSLSSKSGSHKKRRRQSLLNDADKENATISFGEKDIISSSSRKASNKMSLNSGSKKGSKNDRRSMFTSREPTLSRVDE